MLYSIVGIIAIFIHFIVNFDVFRNIKGKNVFPGERVYLFFLLSVIAYHITDAFWGILYDKHLATAVFIDTTLYFVCMASSILLWGMFVKQYLDRSNRTIIIIGAAMFFVQIITIVVNLFYPVLFSVSKECVYSARPLRYVMLGGQIFTYLMLCLFTLISSLKRRDSLKRRYLAICFFSAFMMVAITLQVIFPLLPMYSFGYLFGICALHSFVVEDEKATQKSELEEVKHRVSIDSLTGVMSKHAYVDIEANIDERINRGIMEPFAMVVFDLNDLKMVNDTDGYNAGDKYIVKSVELIQECFKYSPIYRVGGDEFTIILTGQDYDNRKALLSAFNERIEDNLKKDDLIIVAAGLSIYMPEKDSTILQTFTRADREMYIRKHLLKEKKLNKDF